MWAGIVNDCQRKGSLSCGFTEAISHPLVGGERLTAFVAGWFAVALVAFVGGECSAFGGDRAVHDSNKGRSCSAIQRATGVATPLPHILYRVLSLLVLPSARWRVWLSGHPMSRSHSTGVRRRTTVPSARNVCCFIPGCAAKAPATSFRSRTSSRWFWANAIMGVLFPPVPMRLSSDGVTSS